MPPRPPTGKVSETDPLQDLETAQRTRDITRGVTRLFADMDLASITEMTLANGRRADVAAIDRGGFITIVEVKASVADYRGDRKWEDYKDFCDRFYFAVDPAFPQEILPPEAACGIIVADRYEALEVRPAPEHKLAGARRRAVTLRFARMAADRLRRLTEA